MSSPRIHRTNSLKTITTRGLFVLFLALGGVPACESAEPPPYVHVVFLRGTPYERGFTHGRMFSSRIRSLYNQLLATSIMPFLNRELPGIREMLIEYKDERYDNDFSYLLFLESGLNLEQYIPQDYLDEMRGISDGSGVEYEKILILNTFMDTLWAFRAITFFIRALSAPRVSSLLFEGNLDQDGVDNNGDGQTDEEGDGLVDPYDPSPYASIVQVPTDTVIRIRLEDQDPEGTDPDSVNPDLIRLQLNDEVYTVGDPEVEIRPYGTNGEGLEVFFTRAGGLEPAAEYSLIVSAGDTTWVTDPPPARFRMMRDVRIQFTTIGDDRRTYEVENISYDDGRSQPTAMSFAVRGEATTDGSILLGHHFSLLDSNTSHKHTVLFIHEPEQGHVHATLGWTGAVFGFSGMNSQGLVFSVNPSDTLDNPIGDEFRRRFIAARLISSGLIMGVMGREMLRQTATVQEAKEFLASQEPTFGWNVLLADRTREMTAVEMDCDILGDATGFFPYTPDPSDPENLDPHGRPLASVGPDDLRMTTHFHKNRDDIDFTIFSYHVNPQRYWSSFYFRSLRSFYLLGRAIEERYGLIDVPVAQQILSIQDLVDERDSMNAVVYEPERLLMHYAMGQVPATSGPFETFDLSLFPDLQ